KLASAPDTDVVFAGAYGASGNGTTDSTAAINAAIAAAVAQQKTIVMLPAGVRFHNVTSSVIQFSELSSSINGNVLTTGTAATSLANGVRV
nr:hypothetical protein [Tanacetum cinerariifolium]